SIRFSTLGISGLSPALPGFKYRILIGSAFAADDADPDSEAFGVEPLSAEDEPSVFLLPLQPARSANTSVAAKPIATNLVLFMLTPPLFSAKHLSLNDRLPELKEICIQDREPSLLLHCTGPNAGNEVLLHERISKQDRHDRDDD